MESIYAEPRCDSASTWGKHSIQEISFEKGNNDVDEHGYQQGHDDDDDDGDECGNKKNLLTQGIYRRSIQDA